METNSLSLDKSYDRTPLHSKPSSASSKAGILSSHQMIKINYAEGTVASAKYGKIQNKYSPYLTEDITELKVSRVTEKTLLQRNTPKFESSFPLAANIYKASSGELKALNRKNKKMKKSVLTLPNNPAPKPQSCTVSDLNECEYLSPGDDLKQIAKTKKKPPVRLAKNRHKGNFEFYDREAHFCSQLNIDLDCCSSETIPKRQGDKDGSVKRTTDEPVDPHHVWAVLRNINRFQFRPSPPTTDEITTVTPRKRKFLKRRTNRKDNSMRFVETCCTEQISVISNYEVETIGSRSSSFDRVTVIDKERVNNDKTCKLLEKALVKQKKHPKSGGKNVNQIRNKKAIHAKQNVKEAKQLKTMRPIKQRGEFGDITYDKNNTIKDLDKSSIVSSDGTFCDSLNLMECKITDPGINRNLKSDSSNAFNSVSIESSTQLQGITKVIVNTAKKENPNMLVEPPKAKTRTSPLILNPIPKLTKCDIRRRLSNLKFPIVILGKDQLSCNYELHKHDFTQFKGLNNNIWPFMVDWYTNNSSNNHSRFSSGVNRLNHTNAVTKPQILKTVDRKDFRIDRQQSPVKEMKVNQDARITPMVAKRLPTPRDLEKQVLPEKKNICMIKDKMLKLLYKSSNHKDNGGIRKVHRDKSVVVVNVGTTTSRINIPVHKKFESPVRFKPKEISPPVRNWHRPKSKWASDLIDNVIKKIKSGVYYTADSNPLTKKVSIPKFKEIDTQTITNEESKPLEPIQSVTQIVIKKKIEPQVPIPGFEIDNAQPKFEIKSMSLNEISVKTCNTNIVIRFDINIPPEPSVNLKKCLSLVPLDESESRTKIFKCKTTIKNSMLPAEICSILPKLMKNLIDSKGHLINLPITTMDKFGIHLTTIQEGSSNESPESSNSSIDTFIGKSPELMHLLNGHYFKTEVNKAIKPKAILPPIDNFAIVGEDLPYLERRHLFNINVMSIETIFSERPKVTQQSIQKVMDTCRAVQVYSISQKCIVPAYKRFNISHILSNCNIMSVKTTNVEPSILMKPLTLKVTLTGFQCTPLKMSVDIDISKLNDETRKSLLFIKYCDNQSLTFNKDCDLQNRSVKVTDIQNKVAVTKSQANFKVINKIRKSTFVKLYKKCKVSKLSKENKGIPIGKVNNLDDFFSVLGTINFNAMFDGFVAHKIMSAIVEMKKWTTQLSPRQALLILLLFNKKDTPNLLLFRSVLLQGIAVNRITRSNELDMEIEVIEREYSNNVARYEGISYLPASLENQDILLEELTWIAKNTASDYQIPFDETSENLLKSLIMKRKQLNPSYLRVMARYVGLGLLKLPKK